MLISSVNFKGGQGKSMWTAILADWLGSDAEILDCDPRQGDAYAWAQKAQRPARLVWPRDLQQILTGAAKTSSWVVCDCPPHEGEETRLALELSSMVLVPVVSAGEPDARAWGRMVDAIQDARSVNPGLKAAVVLNAARKTAVNREFVSMLQQWHAPKEGQAVLGAIPQHIAFAEAFAAGKVPGDESIHQVLAKLRRFAAM